ncbi:MULTISPECIES: hypothetical protein [unclassified Burkholderia]|uniref:hypothetical protein n=1 Tax=unclassified Burkholderia TaxID=2613784 RepID=UPI000F57A60F|nr:MULTISPECIES: hypothetical protein [unclassified Burkholderia]RQR34290.1 hypothetical protein DIE22_17070 [Burkholderia sp. Bp9142]RQR53079.1 hypothetical protein DIE21_11030 [Burkholderia sp. Bp9140]
MNAASNARQIQDAASTGEGRGDEQRTVAPTRTRARVRATTSRGGTRRTGRGRTNAPVTTHGSAETGEPHWEDDDGAMPPEEWS